nr:alpha/beta fold hydrolase [Kibdelosporangium sp. MJ126-NF4]CEL22987.1 putative ABC transporter ATP-binding protein [Kibdelosporangium sp. MJ126-NF4]CTQ90127.1 putative ABC transporter ATP-binding protein [Kibdelosporangium sp. MJ126-NF4]
MTLRRRFVSLLAVFLSVALIPMATPAAAQDQIRVTLTRIPVAPGVELSAGLYEAAGPGTHPLIVFPPAYGTFDLLYVAPARKLAEYGYDVVAYTPRGQYGSSGENNMMSPTDVDDVSRVIDWAGANLGSDTTRVGATGISQGSLLSLLAASQDKRIRAVSAMSTSADMVESLLIENTWLAQFSEIVATLSPLFSRPGPDVKFVASHFRADDRTGMADWRAPRAVADRVAALNENKPAIMIANGWQDGLFGPRSLVTFFDKLTTARKLLLLPGDHTIAELGGVIGTPNEAYDTTYRWFDHYLRGIDNGIDAEKPVRLRPTLGGPAHDFDSWQASAATADRRYLTARQPTGDLAAAPETGWSNAITGGVNTAADNAPIIVGGAGAAIGLPVHNLIPLINRANAGVWQTPAVDRPRVVTGTPRLHLTLTPGAPRVTVIAYLYDVDAFGIGRLLSHIPHTAHGLDPAAGHTIDVALHPLRHTIEPGHRLVLAIDTADQRYRSDTASGQRIGLTSPASNASYLDIPWGA